MVERAYLDNARSGAGLAALDAEVARILAVFEGAGAQRVDPAVLQPADVLLDLYGEDIRARAFVTGGEADGAEQMLRPDFTVPVVQRHMARGAEPARYAYAGPVWRRQGRGHARAQEYLQVGFEIFDGADPAAADAEVYCRVRDALAGGPLLHPRGDVLGGGIGTAIGDMGLLLAAVDGLATTDVRRAALRRHIWRPRRFERLLARFSTPGGAKPDLVAQAQSGDIDALIAAGGKALGLRSPSDVADRIARLLAEAQTPPLDPEEVDLINRLLTLKAPATGALSVLEEQARRLPALGPAVARFAARLEALAAGGVDVDNLPFEGSYGRTRLEYYDGFVFGFFAPARRDLPVIATGGRYDALTKVLGADGAGVPAVGGILRPEALLALRGTGA